MYQRTPKGIKRMRKGMDFIFIYFLTQEVVYADHDT